MIKPQHKHVTTNVLFLFKRCNQKAVIKTMELYFEVGCCLYTFKFIDFDVHRKNDKNFT